MASYLPPTENLPIFDNQVFNQNDVALTYSDAKKYFVTFPSAQGASTITDLIAGSIDYLAPLSGSYFEIGTNQVSGGTIRLGPTGTSGVSVHAGNIDCTNNTINNATDASLNNLSIANSQTSGVLNLGTGARATSGNGGAINIGTGSGSTAPINIGMTGVIAGTSTVNINTSVSGAHPVNIGSLTSLTTVNGALTTTGLTTANGGLTIGGANGITLTSSSYTPSIGQLGYVITGAVISGFTAATSGNTTSVSSISLTAGTWIVNATRQFVSRSLTTGAWFGLGQTLKNNVTFASGDVEFGVVTPSLINDSGTYANIVGIVTLTTPTTIYLNYNVVYTGSQPTIGGTFATMKATRIA
jgi:hypothetical protein